MRNHLKNRFWNIIGIFLSISLLTCAPAKEKKTEELNLILVRPTEEHLSNIVYLIKEKIINIPSIKLTGIYHESDSYSYQKISDFVIEKKIDFISLIKIDCDIELEDIYKQNDCTNTYHDLFENADGIIFFGGTDVTPITYNKKNNLLTNSDNFITQYFELSFVYHLLGRSDMNTFTPLLSQNADFTVMGICQGLQIINIATGGTLVQDIPSILFNMKYVEELCVVDTINHYNYWTKLPLYEDYFYGNFHSIKLLPNSFFTQEMKMDTSFMPKIMSAHHQCIDSLSPEFIVIARSPYDNIPEAIQHKIFKNVFALQFHPELHLLYDDQPVLFSNNREPQLGRAYLIEHKSLKFHESFWGNFSRKIIQSQKTKTAKAL